MPFHILVLNVMMATLLAVMDALLIVHKNKASIAIKILDLVNALISVEMA